MGSLAGERGYRSWRRTRASGGRDGFHEGLGKKVVRSNIFVNCVAPAPIDTD